MSTFGPTEVLCPGCLCYFEVRTADSINVTRMPSARVAILEGSFHQATCPRCARKLTVERMFLYTDVTRGLFVQVFPFGDVGTFTQKEDETAEVFALALQGVPAHHANWRDRFRVRTVFGLDALAEKIRIEDANLDDRLIELCKLEALCEGDALRAAPDLDACFEGADGGELILSMRHVDGTPTGKGVAVPRERYAEMARERPRLEARFLGLFTRPYASFRRLGSEPGSV